ncbi:hypothetical protein J3Q64DRAFT_1391068 [Phycomyces blakesleeanus]|uniref:Domain of unknown function at the cortex 1 domain-containing protein n=2 Tax=Phycomyces blakesleeanus TaxID=4837 RepID=A0A167LEL2_PHYB8|nr:hypothetical protein PHYBLDRAFT_16040 [Phycomyces blakesleeanus NRRL 1555(-)]OAD70285.1 hypothetical protein PHYBLDRAFT_16040 [Phycomyces blakesleeanus NRRL 1555(-)]|eukprot:XP_018288325.1 hypothetical protein PHYBLDRAFT_16040 [Phycomyces blakesleeanus NRRL 1555(-)]
MSTSKHSLRVTVGPSVDTLRQIHINQDSNPIRLQTELFDGYIVVRLKDYPDPSAYFDTHEDKFCIQVVGRFLQDCTADDILFGNEFEAPLTLPFGSSIAFKFATWFDPGLQLDLYSDHPQAFSPLIVTMNRLAVHKKPLPVWPYSQGQGVEEDTSELGLNIDNTSEARKAYFIDPAHRKAIKVDKDQVWSMDFCNPYLDFKKCTMSLPGFEVNVLRYWDGQPLRYVAKSKNNSAVFFIIQFELTVDGAESTSDEVD